MAREIERKFLVLDGSWRPCATRTIVMRQGYLGQLGSCSVRVRLEDGAGRLNIKSATLGIEREEFEYPIPTADAEYMLANLCGTRTLDKVRHLVPHAGHLWEIDEFGGANSGLIVAEIELADAGLRFPHPPWLGAEVSDDPRYYNVCLVDHPYERWRAD